MRHFNEPNENDKNPKYPCGICLKTVGKRMKAIQCDLCNYWNHIKCDGIDNKTYEALKKSNDPELYYCKICKEDIFPFQTLSNDQYCTSIVKNIEINENLNLKTSPSPVLKVLFDDLDNSNEESPINCGYYDYSTPIKNSNNDLSMFHLNIASLGLHKEELVNSLSILDVDFDVIAVTETKIRVGIDPIFDLSIPGYKAPFQTPTECAKGGALLYVKSGIDCKQRKDLEKLMYKSCELESVFIETINEGKKNKIFACIYRHPSMELDDFNNNFLEPFLMKLSRENKTAYLLGDFNVDLLKTDTDDNINNYYNILTSNLFVPHITLPTRITSHSNTLIDNIFSNDPNFLEGVSGNFTISISDHLPQFLIMPRKNNHPPKKHNIQKRDIKSINKESLVADFLNTNWHEVLSIPKMDVNQSYACFDKSVNEIIDKHAPLKKLNKKELKLREKPWITPDIIKTIKIRDKLLRSYIKANEGKHKEQLHKEYKKCRNKIVSMIRNSKKMHFQNYFAENAKDIKKTWNGIKNIINIRTSTKTQPTSILIDQHLENNPTKIAEGFNSYFSSIAEKLQQNIIFGDNNFSKYLSTPLQYNFLFRSVDETEIVRLIDSLENSKASGPHSIPTEILKLIKFNICYPLKEIINLSFATGVYPDILKIAKVIPIFKNKGDLLVVVNYRPISLLSNINKIFEKLVYSRLYSFLNLHNCIYELQFGFRAKHSTDHALISLTEMIREALDSGCFAGGIFIDLQKAFDTVDHHILLDKLNYYGIRGLANKWFKSYLSNRQQFVSINGYNSNTMLMKYGVPQGSVLGPLLFLIYINDLHKATKISKIHHFADDTNLLVVGKTLKKIQKDLNIDLKLLCKWLKANKISLNASKTELIIFRDPKKKSTYELKIKIDGKKLFPSRFVKYLGIFIDDHLNWHANESAISTKLSRATGMLYKIRHFVKQETLRMIYYGIFSSILMYGSHIWGQNKNIVDKLQILQNKALRAITFESSRASAPPLFKRCQILMLVDNIKLQNFMFIHDSLNNNLPSSLSNKVTLVSTVHYTRNEDYEQLDIPTTRTITYGSNNITSRSVHSWNDISRLMPNIKFRHESKAFCKKMVTKFMYDSY